MKKENQNPKPGDLVHTFHPNLPIMQLDHKNEWTGYLPTTNVFIKGTYAIVSEVTKNMGKLIFTNGTTGWCNLCYLYGIK